MGEYAIRKADNKYVKIGTCESMYYMRADQINDVWPEPGNVDPVACKDNLLFRFPFPSEDEIAVGSFDGPTKGIRLNGDFMARGEFVHGEVQFKNSNGYLVSLPCPESYVKASKIHIDAGEYHFGLNGYGGHASLVGQRYYDGKLVALVECNGCKRLYRLPTKEDVMPVVESLQAEVDKQLRYHKQTGYEDSGNYRKAEELKEIIRRLLAGYEL